MAPGILLGYTPTTEYESNDYNLFDLSFGWDINDTLSFRGGITNLFDTDPEVVGRARDIQSAPTWRMSVPSLGRVAAGLPEPAGLQLTGAAGGVPAVWSV